MKTLPVGGAALAVLCAPVVLALAGPGGLFVMILVVPGTAIFAAQLRSQRARDRLDTVADPPAGEELVTGPSTGVHAAGSVDELGQHPTCSDEELCWAWRRSFAELQRTTDPVGVARLAADRQAYLDELERRHPARFAHWISSGARAASDPHPFIRPRRTP